MTAALLREAAKAMRERAEAATPGPWRALTTGVQGGDHWYVCDAGEALAWIAAQDGVNEEQREPDARHVASWHPAVALAVADWLDSTAAGADEMADILRECGERTDLNWQQGALGPALAVAEAYLVRSAP